HLFTVSNEAAPCVGLFTSPQMFQTAHGDVLAIVHAIEANFHHRVISFLDCIGQVFTAGGHAQHTAAGSVIRAIALVGSGVEDLDPIHAIGLLNAGDDLPRFECA